MANETYLDLINQAITDFNSIHSALAGKAAVSGGAAISTSSSLATSSMAGVINNQLWRIGDRIAGDSTTKGSPVLVDGVISDFGGVSQSLAVAADNGIVAGDNSLMITTATLTPGYYDNKSYFTISLTDKLEDVGIANATLKANPVDAQLPGTYVIKASEGKIIDEVTIDQGRVTTANALAFVTTSENPAAAVGTIATNFGSLKISNSNSTGAKAFTLTPSATVTGKVKSELSKTVSAGYVTAADVTLADAELSLASLSSEQAAQTFYIEAGGISDLSTGSAAVALSSNEVSLVAEDEKVGGKTYYAIAGNVKSGENLDVVTVTGNIKEGYVDAATGGTIGTASVTSGTVYVAKADVQLNASDTLDIAVTSDASSIVASGSDQSYSITVGGSKNIVATANPGYIKTTEEKTDVVSATKEVKIKKGSFSQTVGATATATTGTAVLAASGYSFTVSYAPETTVARAFTEGYIKASDANVNLAAAAEKTFYVQKGSVAPGVSISATAHNNSETDGDADSEGADGSRINLFQKTAPTTGDYYSVIATAGAGKGLGTLNPGYITADDLGSDVSDTLYIPKATFKYVTGTAADGSDDVLMVEKGGYVPSGTLTNIAQITGSLDAATADLVCSDAVPAVTLISGTDGAYTINLAADVTNAGYLSSSQNELSGALHIKAGSASLTASEGSFSTGAAGWNETSNTYDVAVTGKVISTLAFSEGYLKNTDVQVGGAAYSGNNNKVETEISKTVSLAAGELSVNASGLELAVTPTEVKFSDSATAYAVTPTISGNAIATVTTAGYVTDKDNKSVAITDLAITTPTTKYIQAGSVGAIGNDAEKTITTGDVEFNTNSYIRKVSGTLSAKATISEGYVKDGTATGNVTFSDYVVDMGKGAATVTPTLSAEITTALATSATGGANYIAINATPSSAAATGVVTKEGYLKTGDQITVEEVGGTIKKTLYVETLASTYNKTTATVSGSDASGAVASNPVYVGGTIGSLTGNVDEASTNAKVSDTSTTEGLRDVMYVDTSRKYGEYDVEIKLSSNAMGSSVVAKLKDLRNRLAGTYVSSAS